MTDTLPLNGRGATPRRWALLPIAGLVAIFIVVLIPALPSAQTYFGDEHFYTDAAIRMVQTGDYLTPALPKGLPRFNKPILTYWVVAAGFKCLGISFLAARIGSLIAGGLVIWLSFKIGQTLFGRAAGMVTAFIVFSSDPLINSSMRSTPDIFLCLFMCLSLYALVRLLFGERRALTDYLCLYLGAGLAIETKGLTGVLPVLAGFAFCKWGAPCKCKPRELLHLPAAALGLLLGIGWFACAVTLHGRAVFAGFLTDQISGNIGGSKTYILTNIAAYSLGLVRLFLPWTVVLLGLAVVAWPRIKATIGSQRSAMAFILFWCAIVFVVFSLGNSQRNRYLLPAYPLIAAGLGSLLAGAAGQPAADRVFRGVTRAFGGLSIAFGLALAAIGPAADWRITACGLILCALGLWVCTHVAVRGFQKQMFGIAMTVFMGIASVNLTVRPAFPSSPMPAVAERIMAEARTPSRITTVGVPPTVAAQLRVLLKGGMPVTVAKSYSGSLDRDESLVLPETELAQFDPERYRIEECGFTYPRMKSKDLWRLIRASDRTAALSDLKFRYYLVSAR